MIGSNLIMYEPSHDMSKGRKQILDNDAHTPAPIKTIFNDLNVNALSDKNHHYTRNSVIKMNTAGTPG